MKKILLIDNNDSFTYNLVELIRQLDIDFDVINYEDLIIDTVANFSHIIISPGPDVPSVYPKMFDLLERLYQQKNILGVCLGHQIICEFFGARLLNLTSPRHGMVGQLTLNPTQASQIFKNLPSQFQVGLYHSWAVSPQDFPNCLQVTSTCQDDIVMSVKHTTLPIFGVQFHPESYISQFGKAILANFIELN